MKSLCILRQGYELPGNIFSTGKTYCPNTICWIDKYNFREAICKKLCVTLVPPAPPCRPPYRPKHTHWDVQCTPPSCVWQLWGEVRSDSQVKI